ncbi:LCP family protein [Romboutsia sp.]|uniref:LCP family protein n=1 Tax=Romboutsia sp. TaxID=1965302 RepID=UPI003F3E0FAC
MEDYTYINKDILNILLIGVDGDNREKGNRSDSMIILTIDSKNKDIRLTSIGRDTYVDIPGYSTEKINHSYAYEGPPLLLRTINQNFGISIDKYITVSFKSFMDIVDEIGGVEVNVDSKNIKLLNDSINSTYSICNKDQKVQPIKYIQGEGIHNLNGYQALAFSRIRYADSGYARDQRQREIIYGAYNKLLKQDLSTIKDAVDILLSNCKTNIAPLEMAEIGIKAYDFKDNKINQLEFPIESHRKDVLKEEKGWVTEWDKEYNKKELKNFIYSQK